MMDRLTPWLVTAVLLAALIGRIAGPSDLYDQDQPKTVAYTADIVNNGRWILPRDMLGRPATKPPLYNWIGAAAMQVLGSEEWVLKLPAIVSALAVFAMTLHLGGRLGRAEGSPMLGWVAGAALVANQGYIKLIYLARPDMVLTACLMAALVSATRLLQKPDTSLIWRILLWSATAAAGLAKGPPALVVPLFVILGAPGIGGSWRAMWRTGIAWGLPLALAVIGSWLALAWVTDPQHVQEVLLGDEITRRVTRGGLGHMLGQSWKMPGWFLVRMAPWSALVILTFIHVPIRRWFSHPTAPASLWLLLILLLFSFSGGKRPDYLMPAYPAAAILAAYWWCVVGAKYQFRPILGALLAMMITTGYLVHLFTLSECATSQLGENTRDFARRVRKVIGDEPVVFRNTGYNPLQTLLGKNQASPIPTEEELAEAKWIIHPVDEPGSGKYKIISKLIPEVKEGADAATNGPAAKLGLYLLQK